ncbi:hypothetical protein Mapa_004294 [Marchantia paleacea]|nr:hypothetical protein Mapa_004294 [Marchantia paleacea]
MDSAKLTRPLGNLISTHVQSLSNERDPNLIPKYTCKHSHGRWESPTCLKNTRTSCCVCGRRRRRAWTGVSATAQDSGPQVTLKRLTVQRRPVEDLRSEKEIERVSESSGGRSLLVHVT